MSSNWEVLYDGVIKSGGIREYPKNYSNNIYSDTESALRELSLQTIHFKEELKNKTVDIIVDYKHSFTIDDICFLGNEPKFIDMVNFILNQWRNFDHKVNEENIGKIKAVFWCLYQTYLYYEKEDNEKRTTKSVEYTTKRAVLADVEKYRKEVLKEDEEMFEMLKSITKKNND